MGKNNEQRSFTSLAIALAGDYRSIYVISPEDDSYVEYTTNGTKKDLVIASSGDDFYADTIVNCRKLVYYEDQEAFLNAFRKEEVTKSLEDGNSFYLNYRLVIDGQPQHFYLKTIKSDDNSIVVGVRNVDSERRKELKDQERSRTYSEIAKSLASQYEVIYYVDSESGDYIEYTSSDSYAKFGFNASGMYFFENARRDMMKVLHPVDYERVMRELEKEKLINKIKKMGYASITYRYLLDNNELYMNLIAYLHKGKKNHLVIGVRNISEQKKQESETETYSRIASALASRYEAIYHINIETNEYIMYSSTEEYDKLGTTSRGEDFFKDAIENAKRLIFPDDIPRMLEYLDKENLLRELNETGSVSLAYKQYLNDEYQSMNMIFVQPKNDKSNIIMGVLNNNAQAKREELIAKENQTFSDISMALAMQYEVIYRVNIVTGGYNEYSASDKYARLNIGSSGVDFFEDTQKNMNSDIYPDDLLMMSAAMGKENFKRSLESFGKILLNYRQMIDGRPQYLSLYAVLSKEDPDYAIVAVSNVDAAKRMEIAYNKAMDIANKDALTCVKNKRAYVQAEDELDKQIEAKKQPPFAIVVCDINGLKLVNDVEGHKAGDEFIKSSCSIICNVFSHSPVYRVGGDEFAVLLKNRDYDNRDELVVQLGNEQESKRVNGMKPIAVGLSVFNENTDIRVQDVFERADKLMYEDKVKCKSEANVPQEIR